MMTNAQAALLAAVTHYAKDYVSDQSILDKAQEFKAWLDKKDRDKERGVKQ